MKRSILSMTLALVLGIFFICQANYTAPTYVAAPAGLPMADDGAHAKVAVQTFAPDARKDITLPAIKGVLDVSSSTVWEICPPTSAGGTPVFGNQSSVTRVGINKLLSTSICTGRGVKVGSGFLRYSTGSIGWILERN